MFVAEDDLAGAKERRDAVVDWKIVEPKNDMVEEMDEHDAWEFGVWKGTNDSAASFLDDPNSVLNVTHMFCGHGGIQCGVVNLIANFLKLVVHEDGADSEISSGVDFYNTVKEEAKFARSTSGCVFDCC